MGCVEHRGEGHAGRGDRGGARRDDQVTDLLGGLHRLRVPHLVVAIAGFTVRYAEVSSGDLQRRRIARLARGDDPRWLWQARSLAAGAGTVFVRAFERGERVHLAMLARGHDPNVPMYDRVRRHNTGRRAGGGAARRARARGAVRVGHVMTDRVPMVVMRDVAYHYPDGHVALDGVDLRIDAASASPCWVPTAPARRRSSCT